MDEKSKGGEEEIMEKTSILCDLCYMDGEEIEAVGYYFADDEKEYSVCEKHGKVVKESGRELFLYKENV